MPFEPKTDSNEFEIAIPEQSTAQRRESVAASQTADLTIRLWRRDTSGGTAALTWKTESVLVYMIADLISASHGRIAGDGSAVMIAHFNNSFQALVAAKRIQNAILEFLGCRPGDFIGAAVLIHPPAAEGFSPGMAQSALRLTEPGQIILSEELARRFHDLPGIELRAVPALTTGGTEHAGLAELVWTSAERMASLRKAVSAAVPTANIGPPVGATMIVSTPLAPSRAEAGPTSQKRPGGSDLDRGPGRPPVATEFKSRDGVFEEGLAEFEERRSFITRSRMIIGVVAIVLVAVGIALFYHRPSSRIPTKVQQTPIGEAQTGSPQTSTGPTSEPSHPLPPVVPPVIEPQVKPKTPVAKPLVATKPPADKPKKPAEDTPIQGFEGSSTYDGMTQKDIPRLLLWARSDAGNGRYEKAGQEYRVILLLQPNNPDAKEGLRKLQLAQGRN